MSIDQNPSRLEVRWRWRNAMSIWIVILAAFVMALPFGAILQTITTPEDPIPLVFIIIYAILGLLALYAALTQIMNQVVLSADRAEILIQHKPIPWRTRRMDANDIAQLFVRRISSSTTTQYGSARHTMYQLVAMTPEGKNKTLMSNLHNAQQARALETRIESYLGIEDERVEGEYLLQES
jgi:hypothetical protein